MDTSPDILERRRADRKPPPTEKPVRATVEASEAPTAEMYLCLLDVSETGWRVNTSRELPRNQAVKLRIPLRDLGFASSEGGYFETPVLVPWQRALEGGAWMAGLHFVNSSPETVELARQLCDEATIDARRRLRLGLRRFLEVKFRQQPTDPWRPCVALELSAEALHVRLPQVAYQEELFELDIKPSGNLPPLSVLGRVIWSRELGPQVHDVGLRFEMMTDDDAAIVAQYIAACS
jgi:hypothetical protein